MQRPGAITRPAAATLATAAGKVCYVCGEHLCQRQSKTLRRFPGLQHALHDVQGILAYAHGTLARLLLRLREVFYAELRLASEIIGGGLHKGDDPPGLTYDERNDLDDVDSLPLLDADIDGSEGWLAYRPAAWRTDAGGGGGASLTWQARG
jgi:hypothetical protein